MIEQVDGLMAEGLTETQAIGQVIAAFGSLDEVAEELGLTEELRAARTQAEPVRPPLPLAETQRYTQALQKAAPFEAAATALFITSPATLFVLMGFLPNSNLAILAGLIVLLLFVAAGVALSTSASSRTNPITKELSETYSPSAPVTAWARQLEETHRPRQSRISTLSTGLFVLSPLWILAPALTHRDSLVLPGLALLLITVALGVWLRLANGWPQTAAANLTNSEHGALALGRSAEDESDPENSPVTWVRVASTALWPLALLLYLVLGFVFEAWGYSWIIWPLAGVIYWLLSEVNGSLAPRTSSTASLARTPVSYNR